MTDIEELQKDIEAIDAEMAKLFKKRMDTVQRIAELKQKYGISVNETIIENAADYIDENEYKPYYTSFFKKNLEISKRYQRRLLDGMRVAFAGAEGAFAQITAQKIFDGCAITAYPDFKSAYKSVESGECDCTLLPLENSFNGDVGQVLDLAFFGKLYINGIYEAEIVQNLLGIKGADIKKIKTVISHPQALGQCAAYIEKHGFKTEERANTALAAKEISESGRTDIAAIASEEAAAKYGLVKLDSHINQSSSNSTRFAVFSQSMSKQKSENGRFILFFTVGNVAGALGKAISVIGEHGFNLLALKSRPTKGIMRDYYFYAEGEGSTDGLNGKKMLAALSKCCNNVRVAGSFEREIRI